MCKFQEPGKTETLPQSTDNVVDEKLVTQILEAVIVEVIWAENTICKWRKNTFKLEEK